MVERGQEEIITRKDFAVFDPIAASEKFDGLEASVFDGTLKVLAVDVAPYVRSIVSSDMRLQEARGLNKGKRMRTTRAAFSALEGGMRSTTRREEYFKGLDVEKVMWTGGRW
jgi:hypothetical protein